MSTFTLSELRKRKFDLLPIGEPWRSAVGRIEQPAYAMIHGPAGSGKSTMLLAFAGHELTRHGSVFYNSSEEGESYTLQSKIENLNITSDRLTFGQYSDLDKMLMAAARAGADFVVVDSISDMGATKEELSSLKRHCKNEGIGLWIIVQERKDGTFRGPSNLDYDTDIVARVVDEGVLKTSKNRYDAVEDTRVPFTEAELREMGGETAPRENPAPASPPRENPAEVVGTWRRNREHDGVELRFPEAPAKHVRQQLIGHGFIFASQKEYWFADATDENVALAQELAAEAGSGQIDLFGNLRENPAHIDGFLTQIGRCMELETTEALYREPGGHPMFTGPEGRLILIVPEWRVMPVRAQWAEGAAEAAKMYETWHGFEPDTDVSIELPRGTWEAEGTAQRIIYESDKVVQRGDRRGEENLYEHDFDAGRRDVYTWGDCLVVSSLLIDKRGILN